MTSRLSELAGCTAMVEEFFPIAVAANWPSPGIELGAVVGREGHNRDSSIGLQLIALLEQVQSVTNRAQRLVLGWSEEQLSTRPQPASWSTTECLEHLALTTHVFLPSIAEIMAKTPRLTKVRTLRCDALAKVLIRMLEPPYRLRYKALPHIAPRRNDFSSAWKAFLESQEELAEIIRSAVGLAIDTVKIQSPVCSHFNYSIYGALEILSAHQRRHLWQMEQILQALSRSAA
jgi:hypothetical protein